MGKHHLRKDTTCQNCGDTVTTRFCSNCGQENTETRQTFAHLAGHVAEDITHYDGKFWLTMRYLLFRPAFLTKEFLKGKRNSYVPPVRLYIFISFITFLLPYILPDFAGVHEAEALALVERHVNDSTIAATNQLNDSINKLLFDPARDADPLNYSSLAFANRVSDTVNKQSVDTTEDSDSYFNLGFEDGIFVLKIPAKYKTVRVLDSTENLLPEKDKASRIERWMMKKQIHLLKYSKVELGEKFVNSFTHNITKGLFIYMPLFALMLWLFHNKKRWFYFDHAIFTLHYFSFLLLLTNLFFILYATLPADFEYYWEFWILTFVLIIAAYFVYFVVARKKMYEEKSFRSFIKSFFIYGVNLILFIFVLLGLAIYSVFTIH